MAIKALNTVDHSKAEVVVSKAPAAPGVDFSFVFKNDELRLRDITEIEDTSATGVSQKDNEYHSLDLLRIASVDGGLFRSRHLVPTPISRRRPASSVIEMECDGLVEQVFDGHFAARLNTIRGGGKIEVFDAEFPSSEVADGDKELLIEGALFRWSVGYDSIDGTKKRFSRLVFRRLPAWTRNSLATSVAKAQASIASIEWADDPCD